MCKESEKLYIIKADFYLMITGDAAKRCVMFGLAIFTTWINEKEEKCVDMNCKNRLKMLEFILEYFKHIIP